MSNTSLTKEINLQKRRERKILKRKRKKRKFRGLNSSITRIEIFRKRKDRNIISNFSFKINDFLDQFAIPANYIKSDFINIPETFSLEANYDESVDILWHFRYSVLYFAGKIVYIDFSKCIKADFGILFLLKVIIEEYLAALRKLNNRLSIYSVMPEIKIKLSPKSKVNSMLVANNIIAIPEIKKDDFIPISTLPLIKGTKSQKHYTENKKGSVTTKLRSYINEGLSRHGVCLSISGAGMLDGLISEVLNNAEDHGIFNTWFATANLFETNPKSHASEIVGEINLAFFNFGESIFEGFEKTKEENFETYSQMEQMYNKMQNTSRGKHFNKENLFTLLSLQEGISRLKYEKESRGTGTMKFINSFLSIGDYEDKGKGYIPRLLIFSGNTAIRCDNKFKPFSIDGVYYLSLNEEKDLSSPPEKSHLIKLGNKFPGTMLVAKIYLNDKHLIQKVSQNENDENRTSKV